MANVGDVTVRLQADLGNFTTGMQQAQAETSRIGVAMDHLTAPAFGATRGLREMEFAMRTMAVQSIGATGGLGNMAAGFAQLMLGGPIMLGVLAAFAAVGLALDLIKKKTDEYTKAIEEQRKVFQAHLDTINKLHPTEDNYGKLVAQLTALQRGYNEQFGQTGDFLHDIQHKTMDMSDAARQMRQEILAVAGALNDMNHELENERLTRWLADLHTTTLDQMQHAMSVISSKINDLEGALRTVAPGSDRFAQIQHEIEEATRALDALKRKWTEAQATISSQPRNVDDTQRQADLGFLFLPAINDSRTWQDASTAIQNKTKQIMDPVTKQLQNAGRTAIEMLVRGMVEGTNDFADLLKNAMLMLVEKAITSVIVKALKIASPSGVAYGWGQNIVLGLVGGLQAGHAAVLGASSRLATAAVSGSPSLHVTMNVPPARDPITLARDADWQRAWRETALVAAQGGFKASG